MNELKTFEVSEYLTDTTAIAEYLEACLVEGGIPLFLRGVGEAARAAGMSTIAERAGVTRASLYKSLSEDGTPAFATIDKVMEGLGLRIAIQPRTPEPQRVLVRESVVKSSKSVYRDLDPKVGVLVVSQRDRTGMREGRVSMANRKVSADRSARTGRFLTNDYAARQPATTVKDRARAASPKKKK